jgi:hypothetical protein
MLPCQFNPLLLHCLTLHRSLDLTAVRCALVVNALLVLQRWHGQLSAVIESLQAAAGVQGKPSSKAAAAAAVREQGSDRSSEASGAARSSYADARGTLQGEREVCWLWSQVGVVCRTSC